MSFKSKKRSNEYQSDGGFVVDEDGDNGHGAKKVKTKGSSSAFSSKSSSKKDSNGDIYWNISGLRRVTISEFRGKSMVNIREYYEKDGQELPGKKGISLPIDQFTTLVSLLPEIEQALSAKGISVSRPSYDGASDLPGETDDVPSNGKKNIDSTSDEDEESE